MAIRRVFVANRGEIAVRIVRAAQALGIEAVQAYSEADADMLAVRLADQAVCVGPPQAAKSYLNGEALIAAAKEAGCDAIHPGYGFLSENADFADAVEAAGLIFVGPSGKTIARMGDKAAAREAAKAAGVPVVPGSDGLVADEAAALAAAETVGYPVMVKAAAGGGGRGIRIAADAEELKRIAPQARAEAKAAFGDGSLYLERVVTAPRHIEVQILGDGTHAVHCYERECSLQRRRQKVWEEAPAACLDAETRDRICTAAADLAGSVGYRGAGTVEFLYDEAAGEFFFIEMNTRLQVEHPVTEMVTGAEDPAKQFMPSPGVVETLEVPASDAVRFDTMLYAGYAIPPFYDSLLGKLIVHAPTRDAAIDAMAAALDELAIVGPKTTIPLHKALARDPAVRSGQVHTQFLEPWLEAAPLAAE